MTQPVDKSIYLEDANGTVYLAEPAGADGADTLYRLTEQSEPTPAIAPPTGGPLSAAGGGAFGAVGHRVPGNARLPAAPSPETEDRPRDRTPRPAEGAAVTARNEATP